MNVIVDTSVWIEHIKKTHEPLVFLLNNGRVLTHPWILGELTLGAFKGREVFLNSLNLLAKAPELKSSELLSFVENHSLQGQGVSWVDAQILASAKLSSAAILTRDRALQKVCATLNIQAI